MVLNLNETLLSLNDAAKSLPTGRMGGQLHASTVLRWILTGARARDGTRVQLEGLKIGSAWVTSKQALVRFSQALTASTDRKQHGRAKRVRVAEVSHAS